MKIRQMVQCLIILLLFAGCGEVHTRTPNLATVSALFDMGGGTAGFAATIYAQEVTTGSTFHVFFPAGSHGLVVLPTSPPVTLNLPAPGTYVFYCRLINEPDDYHYGYTGCATGAPCPSDDLLAIDVAPGGRYSLVINNRSSKVPDEGEPVTVPWRR